LAARLNRKPKKDEDDDDREREAVLCAFLAAAVAPENRERWIAVEVWRSLSQFQGTIESFRDALLGKGRKQGVLSKDIQIFKDNIASSNYLGIYHCSFNDRIPS
jgi:hypothetical protein